MERKIRVGGNLLAKAGPSLNSQENCVIISARHVGEPPTWHRCRLCYRCHAIKGELASQPELLLQARGLLWKRW